MYNFLSYIFHLTIYYKLFSTYLNIILEYEFIGYIIPLFLPVITSLISPKLFVSNLWLLQYIVW